MGAGTVVGPRRPPEILTWPSAATSPGRQLTDVQLSYPAESIDQWIICFRRQRRQLVDQRHRLVRISLIVPHQ
jgi:hypothetical protein